jgi:hypothetical protein
VETAPRQEYRSFASQTLSAKVKTEDEVLSMELEVTEVSNRL